MPNQNFNEIQSSRRKGRGDFRDFKKHYVRVNGWLPALRHHSSVTGGQVRYLTFCAKEAIDVRYFAQKGVLFRNEAANEYPFLTFIESNEEDYAIIAETLGRVRLAIHADIEGLLLDTHHPRHSDLVDSFPYHVINLDFCGHIVPRKDHPYSATLRCIAKVVELQANSGVGEWHLFLTFRAQRAHTNDEANSELRRIVEGNLTRQDLRQAYGNKPSPSTLLDAAYPEFLRLSIAKFLAHSASNRGYAMNMESSWVYGRQHGTYHIVKLVAALQSLHPQTSLPNPHGQHAAYETAVIEIFNSQVTNVDSVSAAAKRETRQELKPVLEELQRIGIVTA